MMDLVIRAGRLVDGTGAATRTADVGIRDGVIVEVGRIAERGHREIDANGLMVTPGWLDIHTHYDGQATWDAQLDPSFSSGVTTALMGLCGVGFAPVRPGMQQRLVELMEGVEEIPGTAFHLGLDWDWQSFSDYLDVLDRKPRSFDIGALVAHGPLRLWAMGDKVGSQKCADAAELAAMAGEMEDAMRAGAFGLATSRTAIHRTSTGDMTPDFNVDMPELAALARPVKAHGGIFQVVANGAVGENPAALAGEMAMLEKVAAETGVDMHMLLFQGDKEPDYFEEQLRMIARLNGRHGKVTAQLSGRSAGAFMSFYGAHPFLDRPTLLEIEKLPADRWLAELRKPEVKARILAERPTGPRGDFFLGYFHQLHDLGPDPDFEPGPERNIARLAAAQARDPFDLAYDLLLEHSEAPRLYEAITNYAHGNLDMIAGALDLPSVVLGVSDAGAHVTSVCDGTMHSFMITHWTRDRKRGPLLPIERIVHLMTQKSALSIGLTDRGVVAPGMKADVNIFDHDRLTIDGPRFVDDLPGGARRLLQRVTGYRATIVSGAVTRENDQATGALPGRLVRHRSGQR